MQIVKLYKYTRSGGGTTVSPNRPSGIFDLMYRIIADEGKVLVKGDVTTTCADVKSYEGWSEIEAAEDEEDLLNTDAHMM